MFVVLNQDHGLCTSLFVLHNYGTTSISSIIVNNSDKAVDHSGKEQEQHYWQLRP